MLNFVNVDFDKLQKALGMLEEKRFLFFEEQDKMYFFLVKNILQRASNYRCSFGGHERVWVSGVKGVGRDFCNNNPKGTITVDFNKLQTMIESLQLNGSVEVDEEDKAYFYSLCTVAKSSGYKYLLEGPLHLKIVGVK